MVDPTTRRVLVRSEVTDPQHELRSGMFANFVIRIGEPKSWKKALRAIHFTNGLVMDVSDEEIIAAVLGNVGTKITFRVGARDARRLIGYQPAISITELIGMPNFAAFVELLVGGVPTSPFTLRCLPPPDVRFPSAIASCAQGDLV